MSRHLARKRIEHIDIAAGKPLSVKQWPIGEYIARKNKPQLVRNVRCFL
jgi:hypothetical protein